MKTCTEYPWKIPPWCRRTKRSTCLFASSRHMSWILALTQKVKFLQEFFPKPLQTAHSGHLTSRTEQQRPCRLRCHCLVTPRAVSSCNATQRNPYVRHSNKWIQRWSVTVLHFETLDTRHSILDPRPSTLDPRYLTLDPRPSTKTYTPSFRVGIRFPSLLFYFCLSVAGKLLLGPVIFIFISQSAFLQSFLNFNKLS